MSKVQLSSNASGTGVITLAAPNTNSNVTLTLPTASGTINTSGSVNEVPAGTVSAPSIYPTGDTNTGIFFPAADTIAFSEGGVESMRIDTSGNLLVGKTDSSRAVTGSALRSDGAVVATSSADAGEFYRKISDGGAGVILTFSDVGGANTLVGVGSANGTFGSVSDANKKKNISDARSYLDDVMKLRVVKYNWITDGDDSPKDLGWIAQEVEQVFPGMVSEMHGNKILKKEVFLPMLMKCIQEQQALIQDLTARLEAVENK